MAYGAARTEIMVAFAEHITISESRCSVNSRGKLGIPSRATDHTTTGRVQYVLERKGWMFTNLEVNIRFSDSAFTRTTLPPSPRSAASPSRGP